MAYAVLRCDKVKGAGVATVHNHNQRKYENENAENVDFSRTHLNNLVLGSGNTHEQIKLNLLQLESKKAIRKDANVILEFVFSASPEFFYKNLDKEEFDKMTMKANKLELQQIFFNQLDKEKLELFKKSVCEFIDSKPEFKNNVVNLTMHLDEKTPHLHLELTPIIENRLTAKKFFTPSNARSWQDDFHKCLMANNLELERGKEFSPAVHQTLAEYRSNELVDMPQPPVSITPARTSLNQLGAKIPMTEKIITTKTELEDFEREIVKRENVQKEKYDFYKDFYKNTKEVLLKTKQALKENATIKQQNQKLMKENFKMNYTIKRFTEEQLENFRQIPLVQVAVKLGLKLTERKNGFARFKNDNINLVINENANSYAENKENKNGFGAINFLKDMAGYDFRQSIDFLGNDFSSRDIARELKDEQGIMIIDKVVKNHILEIPKEQVSNTKNIVNYLTETRAIEPALVKELLDSKRLYADKLNNCVFTSENNSFAYVRGTHKEKRFVSNKGEMNFLKYENTPIPEKIYLFESVIDLMSYRTLNPEIKANFVSIQGSAMANRLNELNLNKFQSVICCFDNDEQGAKFDLKVKEIFPNAVIKKSLSKDFNEDLLQSKIKKEPMETEKSLTNSEKFHQSMQEKLAFGRRKPKNLTKDLTL